MLNQSLYYTIQYGKPNTNLMGGNTTPLVTDVAKKLGSLRVKMHPFVVKQIRNYHSPTGKQI